ncbi:MAG TPA: phosphoenolpyruvate carboxykinase (GTP), partial [bacterium]|nr:phosphoenolpyruvate carboxykinase (GTP) [bacterium]
GRDILAKIGGIRTLESAYAMLEEQCAPGELAKIRKINSESVLLKIANAVSMLDPDSVMFSTGSESDIRKIREISLEREEEYPLKMKNHTVHFDLPQEQARIVNRTYYIVNEDEDVSVLARKTLRDEAYDYIHSHMVGIARGMELLIGFFSRGPIGARGTLPALEITTSAYVMHSAHILYRNAYPQFDEEVNRTGLVLTNVHSQGPNRPEDLPNARVFMDRSWLTTYSMFCTYAGNTLLLKKGNHRFAVDLATYFKTGEELSEHMFITGLAGDGGRKTYFAGAAPSGCGKTTTAMTGTDFVGDDLAQLWIADDGTLRAINPEKGVFSIVEDVNREGDPHLMKALREEGTEVIWSNVLIDESGIPHWVGHGEPLPGRGRNFQGDWWQGKTDTNGNLIPPSHPNARCTLQNTALDNHNSAAAEVPEGVQIHVITYSGRDGDTMPPVVVAKNPDHGVVFGASILSEATATEVGVSGIRRQPWANEPFIPGPLGHYMDAQFRFFNSERLTEKPVMANLNFFLTHKARGGDSDALLGEKRDVIVWLTWLEQRVNGEVDAVETPIGCIPLYEDLHRLFQEIEKSYSRELYDQQFSLYIDNLLDRIALQENAYKKGQNIPPRLFEVYEEQHAGLEALRREYGSIVRMDQLIELDSV